MTETIPRLTLLAQDPGTVITVVFLVISFIGWLLSMANKANNPPPPQVRGRGPAGKPPRPAAANRPQDKQLSAEIDAFLREVGAERERPQQQQQPVDDVEIEVVPEEELRERRRHAEDERRPVRERRPEPERRPERPRRTERERRSRPVEAEVQQPHRSSVADHVQQYMDNRVERDVADHVRQDVDDSVTSHLGTFRAAEEGETNVAEPHPYVNLLQNPEGVRQAVVVGEILSRPRSLRRD